MSQSSFSGGKGASGLEMTTTTKFSSSAFSLESSYLSDISQIKQKIEQFKLLVTRIDTLNEQALIIVSDRQQREHSNVIDEATSETKKIMQSIKSDLQKLFNLKLPDSSQDNIRKGQYTTIKRQFIDTISKYRNVEQKHRQQVKSRLERQYRIVRPDATEEEIKRAVDGDDTQVFSQSVLQTARVGEAKRALKEVEERHMDIQKIVKGIEELNALYLEMQSLVEQQDGLIDSVETHIGEASAHLGGASDQLDKGIALAISSRKKKFFLLILVIVIAIILAIVLWYSFK